jgi:hypothetical protein
MIAAKKSPDELFPGGLHLKSLIWVKPGGKGKNPV